MSEKFTEIIHPDIFVRDKSSAIISRLCRKDHQPTDAEIATLVVQYLWRYHKKGVADGSLGNITGLMSFMEYYFAHMRFLGARFDFSRLDTVITPVFNFLEKHGYAVSMLGDVSSTTAIVKAVIGEKLQLPSGQKFQGLDIGAGSGILALAQYILARRNGFSSIRIDGLEQNVHVARQAEATLRSFVPGGVFHLHGADATRDYAYKKIPNRPDFVSIEMIPFAGSDMIINSQEKSGANTHADPFVPTLFALSGKFPHLIDIACFPHSLRSLVELSREQVSGVIDFSLSGEKGLFHLSSVKKQEDIVREIGRLSVNGIRLSSAEDSRFLPDIGTDFLDIAGNENGWIKPLFVWRHRWRKLIEHNPKYKYLLDLFNSASEAKKKEFPVMPPLVWRDTISH